MAASWLRAATAGMVSGGRCGGRPPAQGRAAGPNVKLQGSGGRGQGSGTAGGDALRSNARSAGDAQTRPSRHAAQWRQPGCARPRSAWCQGGVAGGVPPHKGGPQARPSKLQGPVVSGQLPVVGCRELLGAVDNGTAMTPLLPEVLECVAQFWTVLEESTNLTSAARACIIDRIAGPTGHRCRWQTFWFDDLEKWGRWEARAEYKLCKGFTA